MTEPSVWWVTDDRPAPDEATLRWVEEVSGPRARVLGARSLTGGISSYVDAVTLETPRGTTTVVLRRLPSGAGRAEQVGREERVLAALSGSGLPVPEVLATDPTGRGSGWPALLMTLLPGKVDLTPADPDGWIDQQVQVLVRIHDLAVDPGVPPAVPWFDAERAAAIARPTHPDLWRAALEVAATPQPTVPTSFVHHDFQHFNLLWLDARISGVLDWESAGRGPAEIDVAHCRLNLVLLYSVERAERFRLGYEAETGRPTDAWFDVAELLGCSPEWHRFLPLQLGGRAPFDAAGCDARVDELLRLTLERT